MFRFFAVLSSGAAAKAAPLRLFSISRRGESAWSTAFSAGGMEVYCRCGAVTEVKAMELPEGQGVVLGTLFKRPKPGEAGPAERVAEIDAAAAARIQSSKGRVLTEDYWGRYVALLLDRETGARSVLRDPMEGLPCYYAAHGGVTCFFSHVEDFARFSRAPGVNRRFVHAHLLYDRLQVRETGLDGVYELQGGERAVLSDDRLSRSFLWTPHGFCRSRRYEKPDVAMTALRETVHAVAASWASAYGSIVEELSGGLDSAILLSGLRRARRAADIVCANHISPGLDGDESAYAAKAAAFWKCALVEQTLDPAAVRLADTVDIPPIPRPCHFPLTRDMDAALSRLAQERGAGAIMSGRAGDQLFYKSATPHSVTDYVRRCWGLWRPIKTAKDRAMVINSTVPAVFRDVARSILRGKRYDPYEPIFRYGDFLNQEALRSVEHDYFRHPWLEDVAGVPPGKVDHIFAVIDSQNFNYEPLGRSWHVDVVNPLISQPLVETCLEIPSYVLACGRRDRGLARRAFANDVPPEILTRRTKGGTGRYFNEVIGNNLDFLRAFLLDGELAREGLIVRDRLEPVLMGYEPIPIDHYFSFMSCVSVEAWLRSWADARSRAAA